MVTEYQDVLLFPTRMWLKEGNWQAECLCIPNPFLAQVLRIFKIRALLMFDLKISKKIKTKT